MSALYTILRIAAVILWLFGTVVIYRRAWRVNGVGKPLLYTLFFAPLWGRFCNWLFELAADHYDRPHDWLTNTYRPLHNWPSLFALWVWIVYLVAALVFLVWKFSRPGSPGARWGRVIFTVLMLWVTIAGALSWDFDDMNGPANQAASSISIVTPITVTDGVATLEVKEVPKGLKAPVEYHWRLFGHDGKELTDIQLGKAQKVVTPKLEEGTYMVFVVASGKDGVKSAPASETFKVPKAGAPPADNPADTDCSRTWKIDYGTTSEDNAVVPGGVPSIKAATTPEQAKAALVDWLELIKPNPHKLVQAIRNDLKQPNVKESDLVLGGCASQAAAGYVVQLLDLYNDQASSVTAGQVPDNGINTGYDGRQVVQNSAPGVSGDRKGIHVHLKNGVDYWLLWRCGNWVFIGSVPIELPVGRTATQQVEAAAPTTTAAHPASTSSSSGSGSTSSSSGSSSSSSSAPAPTSGSKNAGEAVQGSHPVSDSTGNLHPQGSSSQAASPTAAQSQAVPAGQNTSEVNGGVAPSGSATPTGVGTSNQGTTAPPPD